MGGFHQAIPVICATIPPRNRLPYRPGLPNTPSLRMKVSLFGLTGIPLGKHNVKDARLDQAHQLVEAKKKTYV